MICIYSEDMSHGSVRNWWVYGVQQAPCIMERAQCSATVHEQEGTEGI
jgi:hypothetical protein